MTPRDALARLLRQERLDADALTTVLRDVVRGDTPTHLAAALLGALGALGEGPDELLAGARAVREALVPVSVAPGVEAVDLCGTGGDGAGTFNVSTAAALVACAAGAPVAKHGNRSVSSQCGSADVLEALGAHVDLAPEQVGHCLREVGLCFMFTPRHHPAMARLGPMRRELGVRTLFNITGPLANPAGVRRQLVGVFRPALVRDVAETLRRLGARRALVVHGEDGLDEISLSAATRAAELTEDGRIVDHVITPESVGLARAPRSALQVGSLREAATMLRDAISGAPGPARDIVVLNAGAALHVAGVATSLSDGVARAAAAIDRGAAQARLEHFIRVTRDLGTRGRPTAAEAAAMPGHS